MENDDIPIDDPSVPTEQVKEWVHESTKRLEDWATHIHGLVDDEQWPQVVTHLELFVRASQRLASVLVNRLITEEQLRLIIKEKAEQEMGVPVDVEIKDIGIIRGFSVIPQDIDVPDDLSGMDE